MKIKSRKKKIEEYNKKYPDRNYDPEKSLRQYFKLHNLDYEKAAKKASKKLEVIYQEREYESIHIIMYEYPMKTDRPRTTKFGSIYSPNAAENHKYFEKAILQISKSLNKSLKLINTPAEIQIDAYLEMPSQVKPDEIILFESKLLDIIDMPDYDNIGKCYTDILKNVLITDDDLFHKGSICKYYSVIPRVEITIRYLKSHESDYIYKKIKSRKHIKEMINNGQVVLKRLSYN